LHSYRINITLASDSIVVSNSISI